MKRAIALAITFPRITLAVLAAITLVMAYFAAEVPIDSSVDTLLPKNDPARTYYEHVKQTFGSDEATVIGVFSDNVFSVETIAKIDHVSKQLADIDGVREVMSITTLQGIDTDEFGA